jgi:hypothetical protein
MRFALLLLFSLPALAATNAADDYEASERCAQIVKELAKNPNLNLKKDEPALAKCGKAQVREVCAEAKKRLDQSQNNQGKLKACEGNEEVAGMFVDCWQRGGQVIVYPSISAVAQANNNAYHLARGFASVPCK